MAWRFDQYDNSIVIDGWENGIGASPYEGLGDCRNITVGSTPGDAGVGFSTAQVSSGTFTAIQVTGANTTTGTITYTGASTLQMGQAISFSASNISGITAGTNVYWVGTVTGGNQCNLYSSYINYGTAGTTVALTSSGTATFYVYGVNFAKYVNTTLPFSPVPNRFTQSKFLGFNFLVDSIGQVWSDTYATANSGSSSTLGAGWTYTGNDYGLTDVTGLPYPSLSQTRQNSSGNGIVWYGPFDATGPTTAGGYVFVFRNGQIDYFNENGKTWTYGWNPSTGGSGQTQSLVCPAATTGYSHEAMVAPDNRVYFCDMNSIGTFYQKTNTTKFDPTNTGTYAQTIGSGAFFLLPGTDTAQCLAYLGTNLLIGGSQGIIYPWDRFSPNYNYPIQVPEQNIKKLYTVNNICFIFGGIRGRIYQTNGSAVELYHKIPDHISGVVDPNYIWGGVMSNKNQLYFSFKVFTNGGTSLTASDQTQYGGIWAIDLTSRALRCTNQLSYGAYSGYALSIMPLFPFLSASGISVDTSVTGTGYFAAWDANDSPSSVYGIDKTQSAPYTAGQAYVDTDYIPIGTFDKPRNFTRIAYLLHKPLVSGESIQLLYRTDFSQSFTNIGTDSTVGNYTFAWPTNWQNARWIQIRAVLTTTNTNPSYVRLKQIRLLTNLQ